MTGSKTKIAGAARPAISVRPARPADYRAICRLAEAMDRLHRRWMPGRFRKPRGPARARDYLLGLIREPDTLLAVAETQGRVVGIVNAGLDRTPDMPVKRPRAFVLVRGIVVDPRKRRQGIGRRLMDEASRWARTRGATEIQLNVYHANRPAYRFFERLGYAPLSHRLVRPVSRKRGR